MGEGEALPWLKAMPLAPEFRPTEAEFADPIAYILKIEKEASQYGICKIIPPISKSPKKVVISNLNRCLAQSSSHNNNNTAPATDLHSLSVNRNTNNVSFKDSSGVAKFTTRQQQIGWSLKRSRTVGSVQTVVQKSVWQSGETYTLDEFEAKAKLFSRSRLKTTKDVAPLMVETLFWNATADKPFTVEYANDIPGTAFGEPNNKLAPSVPSSAKRKRKKHYQCKQKKEEGSPDAYDISNTAWNMRIVSRSNGSLLRYMPVEVAGVTSPMVYIAMLFSWFAWHVEDHDLHSLNYLHTGASKTWYAVPGDAAPAFEEVVRREGYGGQVNPLVAFAMLGEKTTVMSPEVLVAAGVPCCRLVQNAGEFVVTFPRAYHLGFSHGFNCGEAANLATPEWLKVAKEAAVRRAATKFLPMLSHQQLLYLLAMGFNSRIPISVSSEPRSSRLKDRQRGEGEMIVKNTFLNDVIGNNHLLSILLQKASTCHAVLWNSANVSCDFLSSPLCFSTISETKCSASFSMKGMDASIIPSASFSTPACRNKDSFIESSLQISEEVPCLGISSSLLNNVKQENVASSYHAKYSSSHVNDNGKACKAFNVDSPSSGSHLDADPLACIACGVLGFASMAIIQPSQEAASALFSGNYKIGQDYFETSGTENARYDSASDGAATTDSETKNDKKDLNSKNVQLNQDGAACAYNNTYAYQHFSENMDLADVKVVVHSESLESFGKSSGPFSKSNGWKESPETSIPNDTCMPKALSDGNNSGIPQISALALLAATYGDLIDSDEENDSNITNGSTHAVGPSNGALMPESNHDLCEIADASKVDVYVSKSPNLQGSPHLSSCMLVKVKKEESHDVFISGGFKPENECSFVNKGPKDSFSSFLERDKDVTEDKSIHSPDQYAKENVTLHSSVGEDRNGFQGEPNVSNIQFSALEEKNQLQKDILCPPVFGTCPDTNQSGYPSEVASANREEPSGTIISSTRHTKVNLTRMELSADKSILEIKAEPQSFTRHLQAGESETGSLQDKIYDTPRQSINAASLWKPCQGFLRPRVFCLEHALEIEKQLQSMGGAQLLLLCHLNYPIMEQQARLLAAEIGNNYSWKDIPFKNVAAEDLEVIHSAIDDGEDTELGSSDWAMQLGMNLQSSVKLSKSPLYSKQMPYNPVLEAMFPNSSLNIYSEGSTCGSVWDCDSKKQGKKSKHKKITVAGKWCGRVWMVNQVHPYLRSHEIQPSISFRALETIKKGFSQEHGHLQKNTVQGPDCKPILKRRNTITSDKHISSPYSGSPVNEQSFTNSRLINEGSGTCQRGWHSEKYTAEDQDSRLLLKPRMTITSDKHISSPFFGCPVAVIEQEVPSANAKTLTGGNEACREDGHPHNCEVQDGDCKFGLKQITMLTPNEQPLMASTENTQNVPIYRRSGLKRKMCTESQKNKIKAQLSEHATVSNDGRIPSPNQQKEIQEYCVMTTDTDGFSTYPKINKDAESTVLCLTCKKQRKVEGHGSCVHAQNNHIHKDMSDTGKDTQYKSGIYDDNIGCTSRSCQVDCNPLLPDSYEMTVTHETEYSARSKVNRQSCLKDGIEVPTSQCSQGPCLEIVVASKSHAVSHSCSTTGELEGGPCTRLRPRSSKPKIEVANKGADKALQQSISSKTISKGKKKVAKSVPSKNIEDKITYYCDTEGCSMNFSSKHDLNIHKRNICTFKGCGKQFFSHKYLVQHRRVHLDDRPLSCPWKGCKMTFKWAWARTEHIRVHTGERPYVCTTSGCGKTFRFVSDFSRHKRKTGHLQQK